MRRGATRAAAVIAAFALLSGGECTGDLFGPIDEPGRIDVTNETIDYPTVVKITTDDTQSYAELAPGATTSVHTITGGAYQVRVVMSGSGSDRYRTELTDLRGYAERLVAGDAELPDRATVFGWLMSLDTSLESVEDEEQAGCDGTIDLDAETTRVVTATITSVGAEQSLLVECESN